LRGEVEKVFAKLTVSLDSQGSWCARNNTTRLAKLEDCAEAVYEACKKNWAWKAQDGSAEPQEFPGLGSAIREAYERLVFLFDDRALHGMAVVCKRLYK
jgi:hypothetical protein